MLRIESLDEEIRGLNADKADIYDEAEGDGFDKPALKEVERRRRKGPDELATHDGLVELYERALSGGVEPPEPAGRNKAAFAAGRDDGLSDSRDSAGRWPSGVEGHGDYELGFEEGRAARLDAEEADHLPPAVSASRARERARAPARGKAARLDA